METDQSSNIQPETLLQDERPGNSNQDNSRRHLESAATQFGKDYIKSIIKVRKTVFTSAWTSYSKVENSASLSTQISNSIKL